MKESWSGALLFLPVPLVLWLFTRQPLGPPVSLALGIALMLTHRLYARPFVLARADRRCLWCAAAVTDGPWLDVEEPLGATRWRACGIPHAERIAFLLRWAAEHARPLHVGILGTLGGCVLAAWPAAAGQLGWLRGDDVVAGFRLGIAASVLPLSILGAGSAALGERLRAPFPLHIQGLIGTRVVLWLFRIVGSIWLVLGGLHVAGRLGLRL